MGIYRMIVTELYFVFNIATTVGLGNYKPLNDFEKIISCFFLLFASIFYSQFMEKYILILCLFKDFHLENDIRVDELHIFFGII
jgi:hypothetical protein